MTRAHRIKMRSAKSFKSYRSVRQTCFIDSCISPRILPNRRARQARRLDRRCRAPTRPWTIRELNIMATRRIDFRDARPPWTRSNRRPIQRSRSLEIIHRRLRRRLRMRPSPIRRSAIGDVE